VAVALCALIFMLFQAFNPQPPPEAEGEGKAAVTEAEGKDGAEPKLAEGDMPAEAEAIDPSEPPTPEVATVEHLLANDLLALQVTNRSPGRGGLVSAVELRSEQFEGHVTATDSF